MKLLAWSYSRLLDYKQCPKKVKYKYLDKIPEVVSTMLQTAFDHGTLIHKLAEDYVNDNLSRLPKELKAFDKDLKDLKKMPFVATEVELAFTDKWESVDWFARNAWLRVKADVVCHGENPKVITVIDYKTGKEQANQHEQCELYALAVFVYKPEIQIVNTELWFFKTKTKVKHSYKRSQFESLKKKWEENCAPMMADEAFLPTPSDKCRWCSYNKTNGGTCEKGI